MKISVPKYLHRKRRATRRDELFLRDARQGQAAFVDDETKNGCPGNVRICDWVLVTGKLFGELRLCRFWIEGTRETMGEVMFLDGSLRVTAIVDLPAPTLRPWESLSAEYVRSAAVEPSIDPLGGRSKRRPQSARDVGQPRKPRRK